MPIDLAPMKGKTAVITGAARGIGKVTALALAEAGADFEAKDWDAVRPNAYWPKDKERPKPWLPERGWGLLTYYSRRFNCEASARLFTPLREACRRAN